MVKKESYLLNTFAGLRVKEIAAKSDAHSWMHIRSKDNFVADILTRGASPDKLVPGSDWQKGPGWLVDDPKNWPVSMSSVLGKDEREVVKSFERVTKSFFSCANADYSNCIHSFDSPTFQGNQSPSPDTHKITSFNCSTSAVAQGSDIHVLDDLINGSASLSKIVKSCAFVLRLRGRQNMRVNKQFHQLSVKEKCHSNPVTALEYDDALKILIHHVQKGLDIKKFTGFNLTTRQFVLNSGETLDLVTLSSRVKNFPIRFENDENFVYVIPSHLFGKRIAYLHHHRFHKDVDTVVTHIRKEFWVPGLRRIVSSIDKDCQFCLITRQKVSAQIMGDMPVFRSGISKPFLSVNVDLFGPLTIKDSVVKRGARVQKKVWGVLFACTVTRAVYLDIAEDYSTESFLHCVRRLMADKGEVKLIISDPGTQLKGACREITEVRRGWSDAELVRFGAQHKLQWKFIMASSQFQNGAAEILIKLCKGAMKSLMKAIGTTVLFMNELFTLLKEVANLVNERPIGLKPNRQTDQEYLSPNSLQLGRCSDRINSGPFIKKIHFEDSPRNDRTRFLLVQRITSQFWRNWVTQYFPTLLRRQKWHSLERNLSPGDVCVLKDANALRGEWKLCRVMEVFPDEYEVVRNVRVALPPSGHDSSPQYRTGLEKTIVDRHVSNLVVIVPSEEEENGH